MKYLPNKNKIAKYILPIMLKKQECRTWVEPFVGGANTIDRVNGNRIGNDKNRICKIITDRQSLGLMCLPVSPIGHILYQRRGSNSHVLPNTCF